MSNAAATNPPAAATNPPAVPQNPPAGYTTITPFLVVDGAAKAIEFYCEVFDASVTSRNDLPDGRVAHAELDFGIGHLQLADPMPDMHLVAPDGTNEVNHSYAIYCDDVDKVWAAAVAAGATSFEEPSTFVTGDRFGAILDPFGHRWAILTKVEDVPADEAKRRVDEWLASQSA